MTTIDLTSIYGVDNSMKTRNYDKNETWQKVPTMGCIMNLEKVSSKEKIETFVEI